MRGAEVAMILIIWAFSFCLFTSLYLLHRAFQEKEVEVKSKRLAEIVQNLGTDLNTRNDEVSQSRWPLFAKAPALLVFFPGHKTTHADLITTEDTQRVISRPASGSAKFFSVAIGVGIFVLANILILEWEMFSLHWCLGMVSAGAVFYGGPAFYIRWRKKRYKEEIEKAVPDFLDLLVLSVDSGLSFDAGLTQCRKFSALFSKALDIELGLLIAELRILPSRRQALESLVARTGSETLGYLTVALNQGEKYGTPIRASLGTVANESRRKRLTAIERNGARLPVLLSIPLMLLILPPVIAISAGPGFIALLRSIGGN